MDIAFVLFPHFTALDLIGPYSVLAYGPDVTTHLVAASREPVAADAGSLRITPTAVFGDLDAVDVVVVPGGPGWRRIAEMDELVGWLREVDRSATYMTSVCTGAFALAKAGLLHDRKATTHWATAHHLAEFSALHTPARVVVDGRYVTGAGVSAGIDMALTLAGMIWGDQLAQTIQLANEYHPEPPYSTGNPAMAPPEMVDGVRTLLDTEFGLASHA